MTETLSRGSRMTKTESLPERLTFEEARVQMGFGSGHCDGSLVIGQRNITIFRCQQVSFKVNHFQLLCFRLPEDSFFRVIRLFFSSKMLFEDVLRGRGRPSAPRQEAVRCCKTLNKIGEQSPRCKLPEISCPTISC